LKELAIANVDELMALCERLEATISVGVFLGTPMPYQVLAS
jgi:hypothetical protein